MRRPYYRTLWTYLQLQEVERIDALKKRGNELHVAGLLAIAFHEPKKLGDEYHRWMDELGMLPTAEEAIDRAQDVIAAVQALDARAASAESKDANTSTEASDGR